MMNMLHSPTLKDLLLSLCRNPRVKSDFYPLLPFEYKDAKEKRQTVWFAFSVKITSFTEVKY